MKKRKPKTPVKDGVREVGKLTLDRLFDNKLINDVMSRIFVKTTKMTYHQAH